MTEVVAPVSVEASAVAASTPVAGTPPVAAVAPVAGTPPVAVVPPVVTGAPEKYADFKLPDGVALKPEELADLQGAAKDLNLTQEAAQKLVERTVKDRQTTETSVIAKQAQMVKDAAAKWKTDATADKEFGGDALAANLATAVKARDAFASPELVKMLNDSGLGNHPEVVRFFVRVGKSMGEDKHVQGDHASGVNSEAAKMARMYPSMVQK